MSLAVAIACSLYLLPVLTFALLRWRADRRLGEIALDVPAAIAADAISVLVLARFVRLETAVLASRVAWLLVSLFAIAWRLKRGRLNWPRALGIREVAPAAAATWFAVGLSMAISRECHMADRAWHIPLVSSLRGQKIPFHNVYQPDVPLEYHYLGDVVAAALQSLSFARMHSSLALSVAHDLQFGMIGLTGALVLRALGLRSMVLTVVGALAPLLSGPITQIYEGGWLTAQVFEHEWISGLAEGVRRPGRGYSFLSFYHVSFRPHCALAGVFIVGFVGAAAIALRHRAAPTRWRTGGVLVACTAALTLTDEASIALLGLMLGVVWIVAPRVVHDRRLPGLLVFGALLGAVFLPHVLFHGTLAPGHLPQRLEWVPWRAPGYYSKELLFTDPMAIQVLIRDLLPLGMLGLAALVPLLDARRREQLAPAAGLAFLLGATFVLLCGAEVKADAPVPSGGFGGQNHRFVTAAMVAAPILVAASLLARSPAWPRRRRRALLPALGATMALASVYLSGVSTSQWIDFGSKSSCTKPGRYGAQDDLFSIDCRRDAGARVGSVARPAYGASSILYVYAGCNPSYLVGPKAPLQYRMSVGRAAIGKAALRRLDGYLPVDAPLRVLCPSRKNYRSDSICEYARSHGPCRPFGDKVVACRLLQRDRDALLRMEGASDPSEPASTDESPESL